MYWALAGVWVAFFLVWVALVFSPGKRRRGLRLFLFVLPLVMFGNSLVLADYFTTCPCLQCPLGLTPATRALSASIYAFHIGRLVVFPLSLYVIATGCGTIYAQVLHFPCTYHALTTRICTYWHAYHLPAGAAAGLARRRPRLRWLRHIARLLHRPQRQPYR